MLRVAANSFDRMWAECEEEYLAAVRRVGRSGWYVLGREVAAFETAFAAYCGSPAAVGCASGLDAIEIALRAVGIGPGDKVLTSPLSAFASALAIIRAGGRPVFCDVDDHGLMDPEAARAAFARHPDIRAILPVHLYGHLADMDALAAVAADHGAAVIEDAAQAIGARRHGRRAGALSDAACFSLYPTKNLGVLGDGGALLFPDAARAGAARVLLNYGQSARYVHDVVGLNSRLDELHAATLVSAFLPRLDDWISRRRTTAARYLDALDNPRVTLLPGPDPDGAGWHLFPVLVPAERREAFLAHLDRSGVQAGLHYPVLICDQKAFVDRFGPEQPDPLRRARRLAAGEVSLPIHPYLTEAEVAQVIATVNAWND